MPYSHFGVLILISHMFFSLISCILYGLGDDINLNLLKCILIGCILSTRDYEASFDTPKIYSAFAISLNRFGGCCSSPPGVHSTSFSL